MENLEGAVVAAGPYAAAAGRSVALEVVGALVAVAAGAKFALPLPAGSGCTSVRGSGRRDRSRRDGGTFSLRGAVRALANGCCAAPEPVVRRVS